MLTNKTYRLAAAGVLLALLTLGLAVTGGASLRSGNRGAQSDAIAQQALESVSALRQTGSEGLNPALAPAGSTKSVGEIASLLTDTPEGVPTELAAGSARLEQGAVLRVGLGSEGRSVFAFPTDDGRLCAALTNVSATCTEGFSDKWPIDFNLAHPKAGERAGVIVWGIAPDDITSVSLTAGGRTVAASLASNVYFAELPAELGDVNVDELAVGFSDGSIQAIEIASSSR